MEYLFLLNEQIELIVSCVIESTTEGNNDQVGEEGGKNSGAKPLVQLVEGICESTRHNEGKDQDTEDVKRSGTCCKRKRFQVNKEVDTDHCDKVDFGVAQGGGDYDVSILIELMSLIPGSKREIDRVVHPDHLHELEELQGSIVVVHIVEDKRRHHFGNRMERLDGEIAQCQICLEKRILVVCHQHNQQNRDEEAEHSVKLRQLWIQVLLGLQLMLFLLRTVRQKHGQHTTQNIKQRGVHHFVEIVPCEVKIEDLTYIQTNQHLHTLRQRHVIIEKILKLVEHLER